MKRTKRARATERIADREDIAEDENLPPPRRVRRKRRGGKVPGKKAERRIDRRARGGQIDGTISQSAEHAAMRRFNAHGGLPASGGMRRGGALRRPVGGPIEPGDAQPSPLLDRQGAPNYEVVPQERDGMQWGDKEAPVLITPQIERLRQQEYNEEGTLAHAAQQARRAPRYNGLANGGRSPRRR